LKYIQDEELENSNRTLEKKQLLAPGHNHSVKNHFGLLMANKLLYDFLYCFDDVEIKKEEDFEDLDEMTEVLSNFFNPKRDIFR
jgi:hypothetical protein